MHQDNQMVVQSLLLDSIQFSSVNFNNILLTPEGKLYCCTKKSLSEPAESAGG